MTTVETEKIMEYLDQINAKVGAKAEPPERNSEGIIIGLLIVCATLLTSLGIISGTEWTALVATLGLGYTGMRTVKKIKENEIA